MQGYEIRVERLCDDGVMRQVCGIDTKYLDDIFAKQPHVELGAGLFLTVKAYTEYKKESLWKRARRWLLIREANFRIWITSRAERGQSDIQTRTPVPVTDAAFHAPLTSASLTPQEQQALNETITSGLAGYSDANTRPSELYDLAIFNAARERTPDMYWSCKTCKKTTFLGICKDCGTVTQF